MDFSLHGLHRVNKFSFFEKLLCGCTLTAWPFAIKHFSLMRQKPLSFAIPHLLIGSLELIPVVGLLVGLADFYLGSLCLPDKRLPPLALFAGQTADENSPVSILKRDSFALDNEMEFESLKHRLLKRVSEPHVKQILAQGLEKMRAKELGSLHFMQGSLNTESFEAIYEKGVKPPVKTKVFTAPHIFQYEHPQDAYVNFANPTHFTGGLDHHGWVQEEQMMAQIPVLPLVHELVYPKGGLRAGPDPLAPSPSPHLFIGALRHLDLSLLPYRGRALRDGNLAETKELILAVDPPSVVNVLSIAGPIMNLGSAYKEAHLKEIFCSLYVAFTLAKEGLTTEDVVRPCVNTGLLGCGAFNGSPALMACLQIYAAKIVGVDVRFHACCATEQEIAALPFDGAAGYSPSDVKLYEELVDRLLGYNPPLSPKEALAIIFKEYVNSPEVSVRELWNPAKS